MNDVKKVNEKLTCEFLGNSMEKKEHSNAIKNVKEILSIPNDYYVGIVPGSDTGAVEIALWNLIGIKPRRKRETIP